MTDRYESARVDVRELHVALGRRKALSAISAHLEAGELTIAIGPNGAGKTTFLRALAGLVKVDGAIRIAERDSRALSVEQRARQTAYLEQGGRIAWPLLVREVVSLGRLPFHDRSRPDSTADHPSVAEALEACGLQAFGNRLSTELSGGERARALLARVLASDAGLLLLDEPVSALDPAWQLRIMDLLRAQCASGRTIVAVLHDLSLALRYAHNLLLFDAGKLIAAGPPAQMLASGMIESVFGLRIDSIQSDGHLLVGATLR